jgi:hypothetical protein
MARGMTAATTALDASPSAWGEVAEATEKAALRSPQTRARPLTLTPERHEIGRET